MKKINISEYKITSKVKLSQQLTTLNLDVDDAIVKVKLKRVRKKLGKLQNTIYAHGKYSITGLFARNGYFW